MRGRAFTFIALLCATWVTARIGITSVTPNDARLAKHETRPNSVRVRTIAIRPQPQIAGGRNAGWQGYPYAAAPVLLRQHVKHRLAQGPASQMESGPALFSQNIRPRFVPSAFLPPDVGDSSRRYAPTNPSKSRLIEVYAYSIWRRGQSSAGALGNGQYGGSQSAVIAAVPILRFAGGAGLSRLALHGRVSVAHGTLGERELAAGLRFRPIARIPVQVIAERRFREDQPDTFAALVAGGQSDVKLPLGFRLGGYGQAGFVSGSSGGPFADLALQAHRAIAKSGQASLAAGAGIWGGGQDNIMRLDVGPNIRANIMAGGAQFQLDASWRFRVAGQAQPGNGPAVTLSTSF